MTKAHLGFAIAALCLLPFGPVLAQAEPVFASVAATLETENVDIDPDDPAIWIDHADPAQSRSSVPTRMSALSCST